MVQQSTPNHLHPKSPAPSILSAEQYLPALPDTPATYVPPSPMQVRAASANVVQQPPPYVATPSSTAQTYVKY